MSTKPGYVVPHAVEGASFSHDELWCDCGRLIECRADDFPTLSRWEFCVACGKPFDWAAAVEVRSESTP